MNRQHTREQYFKLIDKIREIVPEMAITQDMIIGFCGETDQDHQDTLDLMRYVKYDYGFMFTYSERPGTLAAKKFEDDVPEEIKKKRLQEVITLQRKHSFDRLQEHSTKVEEILIEGTSKKSSEFWMGRNTQNIVVVFPKANDRGEEYKVGDFVMVQNEECTSATVIGYSTGYSSNN
jgi:tRNA-2-methylthio-N6-dimethylallyladenosine synthase